MKRGVTHQLSLVGQRGGMQVDPVADENFAGTLSTLEMVERWILWGDEDILDANRNTVNYDGLITQLADAQPSNIVDWEGNAPSFDIFNQVAFHLFHNTKLADFSQVKSYTSGLVTMDLARILEQAVIERRAISGQRVEGLVTGDPVKGHSTGFGYIPVEPSVMMEAVDGSVPLATADADAPAAPSAPTGVDGGAGTPGLPAGTYYYKASAIDDDGESLPSAASAGIAVAAGHKATLTIGRVSDATFYRVYRLDNGTYYYIGMVAQPVSGDATFNDANAWRPNTSIWVFGNFTREDITLAQLAPLIKYPLAVVDTTVHFLLLLYHTLALKAPERFVIYKNIGRYVP